jgi:hypothetical protein
LISLPGCFLGKECWLACTQIRIWQALCILSPAVPSVERKTTLEQLHTILEVRAHRQGCCQ